VEPDELTQMIDHLRDVERALGDGTKSGPSDEEAAEMYANARRSLVASCDIARGTKITREMLTVKRPGFGIKPRYLDALVGREAAVDIEFDEVITWDMI
jgi:sialic acid synthase SpsE